MIALVVIAVGTLLNEVSSSIGKWEVLHKKEAIFVMGFLELFWATLVFIGWSIYTGHLELAPESLPYFLIRLLSEICVLTIGFYAIVRADRGTFSLFSTLTIPLLLIVDVVLGYDISIAQVGGMLLIAAAFIFLLTRGVVNTRGLGLTLLWATTAVASISFYKYDITHFNHIETEQMYMYIILLGYCAIGAFVYNRTNPFNYLFKYPYTIQSISRGMAAPFVSLAYIFGPSSVIVAGKRAFTMIWSLASGNHYFHEKSLLAKIVGAVLVIGGVALLVV